MIKIHELNTSKSMLQNLTEQEASAITGGASNVNSQIKNLNDLLSNSTNSQLSNLMISLQSALSKIVAQLAANSK